MACASWLINRLKAMSISEILWRVLQITIQAGEKIRFKPTKRPITGSIFNQRIKKLAIDAEKLQLNWYNQDFHLAKEIPLLGEYDYQIYKKKWNAGFQTNREWPVDFSYSLHYKERDDIGDARTNWELNRHFQFALLAKNYYASHDKQYLTEFRELFADWNRKNPFLWGISWTSVMEVAIRCSNWCYAFCFLKYTDAPNDLLNQLQTGILNMADYITKHYSRYSSANNHLIIEAYAVGQAGVLCSYQPWIKLAIEILTKELLCQNYFDGVNKELSLHYQSFYMEAMGLMLRLFRKNDIAIPDQWESMLKKMCTYVADCMGDYGEIVAFGDDDDGKILDLQGGLNYHQYVLGIFSYLFDKQYIELSELHCENLNWLFCSAEYNMAQNKPLYYPLSSVCYKEGGNTILRSKDRRILIGIDHAALGFGSIAAHGHADALSFQMFVDGMPVFVDPGTYIYHCNLPSRNAYRRTENHNTVCINGQDQSEMLGAFLWGRKAVCRVTEVKLNEQGDIIEAEHNGYAPVQVKRRFEFDRNRTLMITDSVKGYADVAVTFLLAPTVQIMTLQGPTAELQTAHYNINLAADAVGMDLQWLKRDQSVSPRYGIEQQSSALIIRFACNEQVKLKIKIYIEDKN